MFAFQPFYISIRQDRRGPRIGCAESMLVSSILNRLMTNVVGCPRTLDGPPGPLRGKSFLSGDRSLPQFMSIERRKQCLPSLKNVTQFYFPIFWHLEFSSLIFRICPAEGYSLGRGGGGGIVRAFIEGV